MKSIYVTFEDDEFEKLTKKKGNLSWRGFILYSAKVQQLKRGGKHGAKKDTKRDVPNKQ